jgi:hypothetical protein
MPSARRPRALATALVVAGLSVTLALTSTSSTASVRTSDLGPGRVSVLPTSPTNAAKIFQWGLAGWKDEFIEPLSASWAVSDPARVRNQNGMLTLEGTATSGAVTATVIDHARRFGRWEARVRSDVRHAGGQPYRVVWELVPAADSGCGDGITLATYSVDDTVASMDVRTPGGTTFTDQAALELGQYAWHTFAIEVTRDHVSWFIDTKVVMTELRPEALTGTRYRMQFRLVPEPGAAMDFTRMQMDWARYYTMERPGILPVEAPPAALGETTPPC